MLRAAQIAAIVSTALAMAPALAHAFEFPGKKRLNRDGYVIVQGIFFPGFTLLGLAEPAALIATLVLLIVTPRHSLAFLLIVLAFICLLGMQAVYWIFTHPTNRHWLASSRTTLNATGSRFFAAGYATHTETGRSSATAGSTRTSLGLRWRFWVSC
jgi:hypothetical protein